jgi:rhodanese-related sulfurtransferase
MENVLWVALALGSGGMLLWSMLRGGLGPKNVSPAEAVLLINREHGIVLDVRNETEFAGGHIPEAKNIPLAQLNERLNELKKYQQKPVVVNCQSGMHSTKACGILQKAGFTQVRSLSGGIGAWNNAKLPVAKGAA